MQAGLHWLLRRLFVTECSFLWMCAGPLFQDIYLTRVNWSVTEHLNTRAGQIQEEGSVVSGVQTTMVVSYVLTLQI